MKPRRKPQRVLVIIKKADALSDAKQRLTGNKGVPHHRTARRHYSPLNVKKEEDDYKDALNTLKAASDEGNAAGVSATRVKTEIKHEEDMAKTTLHSSSATNQRENLHRTNYFWSQLPLQTLRHYIQKPKNGAQSSTISSQEKALQSHQAHQCRARHQRSQPLLQKLPIVLYYTKCISTSFEGDSPYDIWNRIKNQIKNCP
ncbi:hypothetical protein MBANPS3_007021 [Mucor bainieri]